MNGTKTTYDRIIDLKAFDEGKTGVKGLVDAGTTSVPSIFVRPPEERSKDLVTSLANISVPVIDFGQVGEGNDRTAEIVDGSHECIKELGIFSSGKSWNPLGIVG